MLVIDQLSIGALFEVDEGQQPHHFFRLFDVLLALLGERKQLVLGYLDALLNAALLDQIDDLQAFE